MFQEILSKKTQSNLELLNKKKLLDNFYLAGGTGLALQIEHRKSRDLDFFTKQSLDPKILLVKLKKLGKLSVEKEAKNTLVGILNGSNISFMTYEFPLLQPLEKVQNIRIASIQDIACMKLSAVSSRGTKRDFIDLYFICQKISLKNLLKLFQKKYQGINYSMIHLLKSLTYFEDAQKEEMPYMLREVSWQNVQEYFKKEVKKIKPFELSN
jgi:hypothetical protein